MVSIIRNKMFFLLRNGFFHILSADVINKLLQFGITIVLVRFLSKNDYGKFVYSNNVLSFFILLQGLGSASGLLQFGCETNDSNKRDSYTKFSFLFGMSVNLIISLLIIVYVSFFNLPIEGATYLLGVSSFLPVLMILSELTQIYFRISLRNVAFAVLSVVSTVLFLVFSIIGAIFYGAVGVIIGRYFSYFISIVISWLFIKKDISRIVTSVFLSVREIIYFIKYSVTCILSNAISSILYLLDVFLVGLLLKDTSVVAAYKTATLIPFALSFLPSSVMTFAYPYFVKQQSNRNELKRYTIMLLKYLGLLNIFISIFLVVFAPYIIVLVFGTDYCDSIRSFQILGVGYFFMGTFRIPFGNILSSVKLISCNLWNAIISGLANILLDVLLILKLGSEGAAIATLIIFMLSSMVSAIFLLSFFHGKTCRH